MSYLKQLEKELSNTEKSLQQFKDKLLSSSYKLEEREGKKIVKTIEEQINSLKGKISEEERKNLSEK